MCGFFRNRNPMNATYTTLYQLAPREWDAMRARGWATHDEIRLVCREGDRCAHETAHLIGRG